MGCWGGREGLFSFPDIFVAPQARATFSGELSDLKKQAREQRLGGKLGKNEEVDGGERGAGQHYLLEDRKQEV